MIGRVHGLTATWSPWLVGAAIAGAIVLAWFASLAPTQLGFGFDAFAYWDVHLDDVYGRSFGQLTAHGAFRYSPPIALLFAPLHFIPWPVFLVLWTALLAALVVLLSGRWALVVCMFIGIPLSIYEGNIDLLIAASVALSIRWPAFLSFALLTKPSTAVILVWFVIKRRWRSLAWLMAVTAGIVVVTYPFLVDDWPQYFKVLANNSVTPEAATLVVRLVLAVALSAAAAFTRHTWLLGIAAALAQPAFGLRTMSVGLAALAIARWAPEDEPAASREPAVSQDR